MVNLGSLIFSSRERTRSKVGAKESGKNDLLVSILWIFYSRG